MLLDTGGEGTLTVSITTDYNKCCVAQYTNMAEWWTRLHCDGQLGRHSMIECTQAAKHHASSGAVTR
jgi:hypothetical protein